MLHKQIKLVVCDLDGTLLEADSCLEAQIYTVKNLLEKKGIRLSFATGRNLHIVKNYVEKLKLEIPYIINNGAQIMLKDAYLMDVDIYTDDLRNIMDTLNTLNISYIAYARDALYTRQVDHDMDFFLARMIGNVKIIYTSDVDKICRQNIHKIIIIGKDKQKVNILFERSSASWHQTNFMQTEGSIHSFVHKDVDKGKTLEILCKKMEIDLSEVMAIGDNYNDISMLKKAGVGVAMSNASQDVKDVADVLCQQRDKNSVSQFLIDYFKL